MARKKARVVLVSGSRDWGEEMCPVIERELSLLPRGTWVIHGGQRKRVVGTESFTGVDYWADAVAKELGLIRVVVPFLPGLGMAGGPVRNRVMCEIALALETAGHEVSALFFHDDIDGSKGTRSCRAIAAEMGLVSRLVEG